MEHVQPYVSSTAKKNSENGGTSPVAQKSWKITASPWAGSSVAGRITVPRASRKSSSREESASVVFSTVAKMLGENVAYVRRAAEDLSSSEARIAVFRAVDCFTFLTGILGLCDMEKEAAIGGKLHGGAKQGRRRSRCGDLGKICGSKERNGYSAFTRGL